MRTHHHTGEMTSDCLPLSLVDSWEVEGGREGGRKVGGGREGERVEG